MGVDSEAADTKALSRSALGQVFQLLRPYRVQVILAFVLVILPPIFSLWNPYLIGRLIDDGLMGKDERVLLLLGGLLLGIRIVLFFINSSVNYCLNAFGLQILVDYRDKLLNRVLHYPMNFFDKMSAGSLTTRLTTDISSVQEFFSTALVPLMGNVLLIFGVMGAMLWIDWKLALAALSVTPVLVILTKVFDVRIRRRFGFMRRTTAALNSFSGETFSGAREVKVLNAWPAIENEFASFSERLKTRFTRAVREYALYNPLVPFLTAVMDMIVLGYGGWRVYQGELSVGEIVSFLGYAALFAWPMRDFAEKYTVLQQALASIDRLVEVSNHELELDQGHLSVSASIEIEFRSVNFSYEKTDHPAVEGLSFHVKPGEKVALLGETGSGKTTTCSLMMRFYEPQAGTILFNGRPIQSYSLSSLRSQIGWVSQDVFLFSATLRENLAFHSNVSDEEIWRVLELVQLRRWAEGLPEGLNTVLKERAGVLSSGQRQLISLARALIRKPQLLIFDEATAYVDSLTEYSLQRALEELWTSDELKNVTSFFIAHRLSTLRKCDKMLVFRSGRIVEAGTYSELMELNGYAALLYREQFRRVV